MAAPDKRIGDSASPVGIPVNSRTLMLANAVGVGCAGALVGWMPWLLVNGWEDLSISSPLLQAHPVALWSLGVVAGCAAGALAYRRSSRRGFELTDPSWRRQVSLWGAVGAGLGLTILLAIHAVQLVSVPARAHMRWAAIGMVAVLATMLLAHWVVAFETRRLALRIGPPPAPEARPVPPGEWRADPTGRHQWRYWGGAGWTEHVADEGVAGVDPLPESQGGVAMASASS